MSADSVLFVGGVRSGKSALAQRWAEARAARRLYVATARVDDATMAARIARHRAERGAGWQCLEAPLAPVDALRARCDGPEAERPGVALFDCVSLWIANMLACDMAEDAVLERVAALASLAAAPGLPLALVSLEAGLGMVPLSAVGRSYQDALGLANQMLARACGTVLHVACGLPLPLKGRLPEELC
ncbi:MAG: bifunctional adenosylcobinamide kinase/adenosylcobinamide-phosphate guanylyltransferase [Desulfovibrio desulfuricans]|nr:bifunctional adenosylcobinamide kinase/adenosylcobinamide-phosphate guanylyltransferase [Desulfovibrio desulfuricans]